MSHTIILLQQSKQAQSRTYHDFPTVKEACTGICRIYENKLKEQNPSQRNITYDVRDLFNWIDSITDLGTLVLDNHLKAYVPHDKEWLKEKVLRQLKEAAQQ